MASNPYSLADLGRLYPPPPEDTPYYEALGRFIVGYAGAEISVHELARKLSNLKEDKARVLFAGSRLGDVTTRLRGLLALSNRGRNAKADIENCLKQLDVIGFERDKLVHRSTTYKAGALSVTNIMTSKSILAHEKDMFTITDLRNMLIDCLAINLRLSQAAYPSLKRGRDKAFLSFLREPWRYKPAPRQNPKKPNRQQTSPRGRRRRGAAPA